MNSQNDNLLQVKAFDEICDCIFNDDKSPETHADNMKTIYSTLFQSKESIVDLSKAINAFKISFDNNPNETIKSILENPIFVKSFGEVFTPDSLISDMVSKLPKNVWKNPDLKWLDNSCGSGNFLVFIKNKLMRTLSDVIIDKDEREKHILENMLYGVELQAKNCLIAKYRLDKDEKYALNVVQHNALTFDYWDMQFDIVVGNPPYNDNSGNRGSGHTLWTEFVKLAYNKLVKPEGYLVYVHPSGWRQYNHKLRATMLEKQIVYLEIHDEKDGQRVFKCNTRYDWYVMHNVPYTKKTTIMCQDGVTTKQNLKQWDFIPNRAYDRLIELMAKNDSDKINLVYSESAYEGRKSWMSREPSDDHIYPCVYTINVANQPTLFWSSKNTNGHFGVPKVIYSAGKGFMSDTTGEYGLTQWAVGVVSEPSEHEDIITALKSDKFHEILEAISVSRLEINRKILGLFRKDFYKEFLP
jgi:hypothetical protein